jgi:PelA/Pel-15E family pectate lyase
MRVMVRVLIVACLGVGSLAVGGGCSSDAGAVPNVKPTPWVPPVSPPPWDNINRQPATWYMTSDAASIADNVIYYQNGNGGWPKNIDMTVRAATTDAASTIDNGSTTTPMILLAKVFVATNVDRYKTAFLKGLDYLLSAQYPNGGWPQYFPLRQGYYTHITFNDGAMIHVLYLFRDIVNKAPDYAFVDDTRAGKCDQAIQKGIDCILKCQIVVDGVKTAWCAQHNEITLAPAPARAYELESESGQEGAGVLQFLMSIDQPSPEIIDAVQGAVRYFSQVKIMGIKVQRVSTPMSDVIVVDDPTASPIWARFYEVGTNRPFFCGRDGIKKYTLAEIEVERRTGYSWYVNNPAAQLTAYTNGWQPKWAPDANVLAPPAP